MDRPSDELKAAYEALEHERDKGRRITASEEKYRTLFANMGEGSGLGETILDPEGKATDFRYLQANEAFYRHTGMARELTGYPLRVLEFQVSAS